MIRLRNPTLPQDMTTGGWLIMAVSVSTVTLLFIWSIIKVMKSPGEEEKMHGFEFETPDEKKARTKS